MTLKEGKLALPDPSSVSTVQSTGGLLSGMLSSSSSGSTGAEKNSDGTVTVRYKLPYASMFVKNVDSYIAAYDEANPDAPMEYDYTPLKESIPWMEILFYLAMLGCTGFLLFSMMRGGGAGGGIMNVGKARVKDERENKRPLPLPTLPVRTKKRGTQGSGGVPQEPGQVQYAGCPHPPRRAAGGPSGYRQDPAGPCLCR